MVFMIFQIEDVTSDLNGCTFTPVQTAIEEGGTARAINFKHAAVRFVDIVL